MSLSTITGHGSFTAASANLEQGGFSGMSEELAVLLLESEEHQKEMHREELASARDDYRTALAHEVQSLREEADAKFRGALVQGTLAAASGAAGVYGAASLPESAQTNWQLEASQGLGRLSEPLGGFAGKTYALADAKAAQGNEEAARWRLDDAREATKAADAHQSKTLDWLGSMVDRDAATTAAILANKV